MEKLFNILPEHKETNSIIVLTKKNKLLVDLNLYTTMEFID